ncbi:MAG: ABC transporter permease [Flavobacteriales bacterium]|nr:ABC transporter permease [Flavobacteriales bacterium]
MAAPKPVRYIRPNQPFSDWLKQLIDRRETLWFFIWKDLKVQYQKPIFGLLWSVFQPLVYFGIILSVVKFSGRTASVSEMPFSLYLISGLSIWNFTTSSILGAVNSIQSNAGIISKSFFPRFYLILSPILKSTLDLLIMLLIVFALALYMQQPITFSTIGFLITSIMFVWTTTLGWSAIAASLVVSNRHIRHAIPVLLYAMIFALPVFYSMQKIDNQALQTIYQFNPIAGAMDFLRSGFGMESLSIMTMASWSLQSLIWLIIGIIVFRRTEKTLADKV